MLVECSICQSKRIESAPNHQWPDNRHKITTNIQPALAKVDINPLGLPRKYPIRMVRTIVTQSNPPPHHTFFYLKSIYEGAIYLSLQSTLLRKPFSTEGCHTFHALWVFGVTILIIKADILQFYDDMPL